MNEDKTRICRMQKLTIGIYFPVYMMMIKMMMMIITMIPKAVRVLTITVTVVDQAISFLLRV